MIKKNKNKQKTYFDVKIEAMLPATVVYRVLANDAESALDEIHNFTAPISIKYNLNKKKTIKATIYDAGCSVIKFIKNFGAK